MSYAPQASFADLFRSVYDGQCALGVVPLENSLHGSIGQNFDLFLEYNVHIHAEFFSRISHCLLSKESDLSAIHTVYSHPQPLGQCSRWLRMHMPESTAAAAKRVTGEAGTAAIGHARLAELLTLNTLAKAIEDQHNNWTRFAVITAKAREVLPAPLLKAQEGNESYKTSILFTLPDKAGALSSILTHLQALA